MKPRPQPALFAAFLFAAASFLGLAADPADALASVGPTCPPACAPSQPPPPPSAPLPSAPALGMGLEPPLRPIEVACVNRAIANSMGSGEPAVLSTCWQEAAPACGIRDMAQRMGSLLPAPDAITRGASACVANQGAEGQTHSFCLLTDAVYGRANAILGGLDYGGPPIPEAPCEVDLCPVLGWISNSTHHVFCQPIDCATEERTYIDLSWLLPNNKVKGTYCVGDFGDCYIAGTVLTADGYCYLIAFLICPPPHGAASEMPPQQSVFCGTMSELVAPLVGQVVRTGHEKEEEAYHSDDGAEVAPSEDERDLRTLSANGDWKLTYDELLAVDSGFLLSPDYGRVYGYIPLEIPDSGAITQPANYSATNPWPDPRGNPDDPPPSPQQKGEASALCQKAFWTAAGTTTTAFFTTTPIGGAATGLATFSVAIAICAWAGFIESDMGRWAGRGQYINCWGCKGNTVWDGTILNAAGVVTVTSHLEIEDPEWLYWPEYFNANSEGYEAQRQKYQYMDMDARQAAREAWKNFHDQAGAANATITVDTPIVEVAGEVAQGLVDEFLGQTDIGPVWFSSLARGLVFACGIRCQETTSITLSSPGQATLTARDPVELVFHGDKAKAKLTVLGLELDGFTLTGDFTGKPPEDS